MNKATASNIILIGFSATGKTEVGKGIARLLGFDFLDTNEEIVNLSGKEIPEILAQDGQEHLRELECQILHRACDRTETVIATGGGSILDHRNREVMASHGMVVCLEATIQTIFQRLQQDTKASAPIRSMLDVPNPLKRLQQLKEFRQPYYAIANWTVHTDHLTISQVCQEVVKGWYYWQARLMRYTAVDTGNDLACEVTTPTGCYPIYVMWGLLNHLGELVQRVGPKGGIYIISDSTVHPLYGDKAERNLRDAGFEAHSFIVPAGEASKTLDVAASIYDWLLERRVERSDTILALGGGMVGDLAGFTAATFLRGLSIIQVPTTLVAMVDASIGGKTAVNHTKAKNIIGAFHQPRLVVADVETLSTLPTRELSSGWAEVIKHSLILDAEGIEFLESNAEKLKSIDPDITTRAIRRSAAIKAQIVSEDERESGRRTLLNYGHTIAHGLEATTNYQHLLHGEAVAIGMMGAGEISRRMELLSNRDVECQEAILRQFNLPVSYPRIDLPAVIKAMEMDKKVGGKKIRWVLLDNLGHAIIRHDVPNGIVADALKKIHGP